ncbi:hypothetical protein SERLA73DRAFT_143184 [Serpula lacrymans var. lacrymans S7.3]|uniref:2'-phosphotransferase n=2 Tax=Serpula lacrymans var. lacrymans TaxID=341189 RepID=F8Q958_SERL3|nr:uncharacterized protein SERLADRAFT_399628 [Serpula lacrymans var. lacrymans S7.9]EGN95113.1 hypothetical protein SERLA73DRAFT_143184 [Serpula lacrymans var. lacrymans S7.3]EGO20601.1 hypothetical protein SERLADRAFT_399628 [Serpula lacrymans var. lacrymans S7.9]
MASQETQGKEKQKGGSKLRGREKDTPEVRISKSLSWLLRHGAQSDGLVLRSDGYARVADVLANPRFRGVTYPMLEDIVRQDRKQRYNLLCEAGSLEASSGSDVWWIRANQGHSIKTIEIELNPIASATDIPMAVHGTNRKAWELISTQGLSKMKRNHIHLAQGIAGDSVVSGMRKSSQILIYIDVQKAIDAGIKFSLSSNGVVLTEGDETGFLAPRFFQRVENADGTHVSGWESQALSVPPTSTEPIGGQSADKGAATVLSALDLTTGMKGLAVDEGGSSLLAESAEQAGTVVRGQSLVEIES